MSPVNTTNATIVVNVKSGSTSAPTGTCSATARAEAVDPVDPLPAPMPNLLLTVTPPDAGPTQFSWPIDIIR